MATAKAPAKAPARKGGFIGFLESPGPLGLPWVGWGVVLVGAAVVGFFWYRNQQKNATQGSAASTNSSQDANALGLAVDPTSGLPYAVEGLVPSGGTVGDGSVYAQQLDQLQQEITALQKQNVPPPSTVSTNPSPDQGFHVNVKTTDKDNDRGTDTDNDRTTEKTTRHHTTRKRK